MLRLFRDRLDRARRELAHRQNRLDALSPYRVLARGYSITKDAETGRVLTDTAATAPGRRLQVRLSRGQLAAVVDATQEDTS